MKEQNYLRTKQILYEKVEHLPQSYDECLNKQINKMLKVLGPDEGVELLDRTYQMMYSVMPKRKVDVIRYNNYVFAIQRRMLRDGK